MFSMGAEIGNISDRKPRRWTIQVQGDVQGVAEEIVEFFENIGNVYLDKYSNLSEAIVALSGDGPEAWVHSPIHGEPARALPPSRSCGNSTKGLVMVSTPTSRS